MSGSRTGARVLLAGALLVAGCHPAPPARNLIVISLDAVRADHVGCYGSARDTTPHLDAFASGGVLFEEAQTTAPWTLPAHASLLTGLYPRHHGLRNVRQTLGPDVPTLATVLAARGRDTGAIVNSAYLSAHFGFAHGFQDFWQVPEGQTREGTTGQITAGAIEWLGHRAGRPFFLFLHYYDAHSDYHSRPEYERMFAEGPTRFDGSTRQILEVDEVGPADARHLASLYDAGIRQLDDDLDPLLEFLEREGYLDDTVVVVTADHGQEFSEHGGVLHGETHYQEILHVPLIFRGAGVPAGLRVPGPVSLVDVAPTVLPLLGVPPIPTDGMDLHARWDHPEATVNRTLFSEASRVAHRYSVRSGRYKLIVDDDTHGEELYDLVDDPLEHHNLAARREDVVGHLEDSLSRFRAVAKEGPPAPGLAPEVQERLRALGYVGSSPDSKP